MQRTVRTIVIAFVGVLTQANLYGDIVSGFAVSRFDTNPHAPITLDANGNVTGQAFLAVLDFGGSGGVVDIAYGPDGYMYGLFRANTTTGPELAGIYCWDGNTTTLVTDPFFLPDVSEGADLAVSAQGFAISRFDTNPDAPITLDANGNVTGQAFLDVLDFGGSGGVVDIAYGPDGYLYGLFRANTTTGPEFAGIYCWDGNTTTLVTDPFFLPDVSEGADLAVQSAPLLGDVNLNGVVNLLDVNPFIDRLSTGTFQVEADCNQDGVINLLDVSFFIDILSGG